MLIVHTMGWLLINKCVYRCLTKILNVEDQWSSHPKESTNCRFKDFPVAFHNDVFSQILNFLKRTRWLLKRFCFLGSKRKYRNCHHDCHATWICVTDEVNNEDQLHSSMHLACVFLVFVYVWAGHTHFGQKLTESTNENFQVCPRKQVWSWIHALQLATYWTEAVKTFASSF